MLKKHIRLYIIRCSFIDLSCLFKIALAAATECHLPLYYLLYLNYFNWSFLTMKRISLLKIVIPCSNMRGPAGDRGRTEKAGLGIFAGRCRNETHNSLVTVVNPRQVVRVSANVLIVLHVFVIFWVSCFRWVSLVTCFYLVQYWRRIWLRNVDTRISSFELRCLPWSFISWIPSLFEGVTLLFIYWAFQPLMWLCHRFMLGIRYLWLHFILLGWLASWRLTFLMGLREMGCFWPIALVPCMSIIGLTWEPTAFLYFLLGHSRLAGSGTRSLLVWYRGCSVKISLLFRVR